MRVDIKPLSVNEAWQGRRYKTKAYKQYERDLLLLLRPMVVPDGLLEVRYTFGLSNSLADWDNPIKPFQDVLQKKYGFNDSRIIKATVEKIKVKKGEEYAEFKITPLPAPNS